MATLTIADLDNGKRDLQTVDGVANSRAASVTTRYGQQTTTLYEAIRLINEKGDAILSNLGFFVPVPYASGLNVIDSRFTVTGPDGKVYAPLSAPFTTGAWDSTQWYVLQNDLNDHKLLVFDTLASAETAAATLPDGQVVHAPNAQGNPSRYRVQDNALVFQGALRSTVNVKDFGAVGDGVTDDTEAFTKALLASQDDVFVPHGVYVLNNLAVNSRKLYGSGTLKWQAGATAPMITLTGDKCVLEGLTFDGNKQNQTQDITMVVTVAAPNAKLLNNRITNGRYKFFLTDVDGSPGVKAHGNTAYDWGANPSTGANVFDFRSSYFSAIGNHFTRTGIGHNIRTGVYGSDPQTPVRGGVIAGNVFYDCLYTGVVVELGTQGLTITGNTFDTLDQGVKMESDLGSQYDVVVSGNTFRNLRIKTAFNFTAARVTFVGNTCLDCAGGVDIGPNSVCSGNTIRNCGNFAASQPSIRASSSSADCIITDNNVTNSPWRGIYVVGPRMIVKGNLVAASSASNIQVAGDDTIVADNIITGGTHGIVVGGAATNTIVTGNNCSGASTANYSGFTNEAALFDATNLGYVGVNVYKTIASDAISIGRIGAVLSVVVDTEGEAASDLLSNITPTFGASVGAILLLRTNTDSRTATVKDNIGNLRLAGDFVMNRAVDRLVLMWDGFLWHEISRSDNG